jgi:hypothetical protein
LVSDSAFSQIWRVLETWFSIYWGFYSWEWSQRLN